MKTIRFLVLAICATSFSSSAQLVNVYSVEVFSSDTVWNGYPAGYSTYRIYAQVQDPTDRISAVFGSSAPSPTHHLTLGSAQNSVWNSPFGGMLGTDNNCSFLGVCSCHAMGLLCNISSHGFTNGSVPSMLDYRNHIGHFEQF
ncbi:MAG: hypothetical protein SH856_12370 [Flavobacteriales bacterium]|nr:hypothetical protein [Flavobacteriales bacterium]